MEVNASLWTFIRHSFTRGGVCHLLFAPTAPKTTVAVRAEGNVVKVYVDKLSTGLFSQGTPGRIRILEERTTSSKTTVVVMYTKFIFKPLKEPNLLLFFPPTRGGSDFFTAPFRVDLRRSHEVNQTEYGLNAC